MIYTTYNQFRDSLLIPKHSIFEGWYRVVIFHRQEEHQETLHGTDAILLAYGTYLNYRSRFKKVFVKSVLHSPDEYSIIIGAEDTNADNTQIYIFRR